MVTLSIYRLYIGSFYLLSLKGCRLVTVVEDIGRFVRNMSGSLECAGNSLNLYPIFKIFYFGRIWKVYFSVILAIYKT